MERKMQEASARVDWWGRYWGLRARIAVVLAAAFLLLSGVSHAFNENDWARQDALVGLKGVYVEVGHLEGKALRLGLNRDQIKTDVEQRLRKGGVKVLTEKERLKTPGRPSLCVEVSTATDENAGICVFSINVELKEIVKLARDFEDYGSIWHHGGLGWIGIARITKITDYVGEHIDIFINEFLATNTKR